MSPTEYGPCGECEVCINLSSDSNMDIMEIDAASNNGVDEIRDLRDKVRFPPTLGKFKVYIIDEVHMLSIGAFNALLKTLEEPPSHVVFILATTEPHKLPATILSRCQRFDFKRISQKVIVDRMQTICDNMNIKVENEGLHTIARWAEGGMRDALSLLDQIISFSGAKITNDDILDILGTADQNFLFQATDDILTGNLQGMLQKISQLLDEGKALNIFTRDLLQHIRNLLIVKACDQPEDLLDVAESTLEQLKVQAKKAGEARLIRSIEILSPLETEMRYSSQSRIILELAAVKLCRPEQEESLEALQDRIEQLEKQLKNGVVSSSKSPVTTEQNEASYTADMGQSYSSASPITDAAYDPYYDPSIPPVPPEMDDNYYPDEYQSPSPRKNVAASNRNTSQQANKAIPQSKAEQESSSGMVEVERRPRMAKSTEIESQNTTKEASTKTTAGIINRDPVAAWPGILDIIKGERPSIHVTLSDAKPSMGNNGVLTLVFPPALGFHAALIEQDNNRKALEELVEKTTGQQVRIKCMLEDQMDELAASMDGNYAVNKAIEVFGEDRVEIVDEE